MAFVKCLRLFDEINANLIKRLAHLFTYKIDFSFSSYGKRRCGGT